MSLRAQHVLFFQELPLYGHTLTHCSTNIVHDELLSCLIPDKKPAAALQLCELPAMLPCHDSEWDISHSERVIPLSTGQAF